jgi:hypothetical protein
MLETIIKTGFGNICVATEEKDLASPPIVFMQGVILDKSLWCGFSSEYTKKTRIYIDMPAHGKSSDVGDDMEYR